jgi:transaldolase/glucose-6-phosphate isomerase
MNALQLLQGCGQSPWVDYLKRGFIENGDLARLVARDGVTGVTSNPSIFEKAIGQSHEYDGAIREFLRDGDRPASEIYEHLAIADIRAAADVLAPVHARTKARDGYVSLECSPRLAHDAQATIEEAQRLWQAVDRPNLMIKIPATPAGLPAIRRLIAAGLNINVTLLFSVDVYEQAALAYIAGLEDRLGQGGDISRIASVASFFVSRIDTAVDKRLDAHEDRRFADSLRGKAAILNARMAYRRCEALFAGPRWRALSDRGARIQRLLWASTGVKDPAYRDTRYVEALIGDGTVNTMPPATLDAFRDHGEVVCDAISRELPGLRELPSLPESPSLPELPGLRRGPGLDGDQAALAALEARGVCLDAITRDLLDDGVRQFADAFDQLLAALDRRRADLSSQGQTPARAAQ